MNLDSIIELGTITTHRHHEVLIVLFFLVVVRVILVPINRVFIICSLTAIAEKIAASLFPSGVEGENLSATQAPQQLGRE
jgi:hypothetical protein